MQLELGLKTTFGKMKIIKERNHYVARNKESYLPGMALAWWRMAGILDSQLSHCSKFPTTDQKWL